MVACRWTASEQTSPFIVVGLNAERHRIRPGHGEHPNTVAQC